MLCCGMSQSTKWRVTAVTALCGAIIGGGIALLTSANFVAATTLEIGPGASGAAGWKRHARERVLSRASLAEMIQRPSLDLYRAQRAREPLEDVFDVMRQAVKVAPLDGTSPLRVSFEYADPARAEATVAVLGARLADEITRAAWADGAQVSVRRLSGPTRPERTRGRAADLGIGIVAGALLASAILLLRRRPVEWYVMLLGFAITGGMAAELAAYLGDIRYPADLELGVIGLFAGVLAGVLLLGRSGRRLGTAGTVLAATSAGAIAAGAIAFAMPQQYISRSILRTSTSAPLRVTAATRIGELSERVLSRTSLTEIILRPSIDLYRAERSRRSIEQVVEMMRRDLMVDPVFEGGADATLAISFRYSDPERARVVVREIVSRYIEENNRIVRQASEEPWAPGSLNLMVLDPPSKSQIPVGPNKLLWMAEGSGAGLGILLLVGLIGRQPPPRRRLMLRLALSAGAAAAVIAAVVAFARPARYLSTATLRMVLPAADNGAAVDDLQTRLGQVVGSSTLVELMQRPGLNLYAKERSQLPVKDVINQLRTRDLSIETLKVSAVGRTQTLRIAFQYPDREKAYGFVQALVTKLVENGSAQGTPVATVVPGMPRQPGPLEGLLYGVGAPPEQQQPAPRIAYPYVEVLDPPSVPDVPQLPDRAAIIAAGLIAGLLLGTGAILLGPRNPTLPPIWSAPPTA